MHPRWRRDGRELYYYDGSGHIVAVSVTTDPDFTLGESTRLFKLWDLDPPKAVPSLAGPAFPYDVTGDGQRFLVSAPIEGTPQVSLTVVLNWRSAVR